MRAQPSRPRALMLASASGESLPKESWPGLSNERTANSRTDCRSRKATPERSTRVGLRSVETSLSASRRSRKEKMSNSPHNSTTISVPDSRNSMPYKVSSSPLIGSFATYYNNYRTCETLRWIHGYTANCDPRKLFSEERACGVCRGNWVCYLVRLWDRERYLSYPVVSRKALYV